MRRGRKPFALEGDEFIGFSLGSDYCAEHEWGIEGITEAFGLGGANPQKKLGIRRYKVSRIPAKGLQLIEDEGSITLLYHRYFGDLKNLPQDLDFYSDEELVAAWDSNSFGIRARGDAKGNLVALYEAFKTYDVAIWLGGGSGPFENAGLAIAIVSRVPNELNDQMREEHMKWKRLKEAEDEVEKKTGLMKKLRDSGCQFFACKAGFRGDAKIPTKYPIVYFLNPCKQNKNRSGTVTVEDLLAWTEGKGPIPAPEGSYEDRPGSVEWHVGEK